MRKLAIILFVIGLLLETAAFIAGHVDNIPFVLRIVSPDYMAAKEGLQKLEKTMELGPGDLGFDQISSIFLQELASQNPPDKLAGIYIVKIHRGTARLGLSEMRVREVIPMKFELSNGQRIDWTLEALTERVNELKKGRVFKAALRIFIIGMITQIIGFAIQIKETRRIKGGFLSRSKQSMQRTR